MSNDSAICGVSGLIHKVKTEYGNVGNVEWPVQLGGILIELSKVPNLLVSAHDAVDRVLRYVPFVGLDIETWISLVEIPEDTDAEELESIIYSWLDGGMSHFVLPFHLYKILPLSSRDNLSSRIVVIMDTNRIDASSLGRWKIPRIVLHNSNSSHLDIWAPISSNIYIDALNYSSSQVLELDQQGIGVILNDNTSSTLADILYGLSHSDRTDDLVPTVVVNTQGVALGLAYSSRESLDAALSHGQGVYQSRKRGLWHKGATSGATQTLFGIALDCDRDTFRFAVEQSGPGFCHLSTQSCWGQTAGLANLFRTLYSRKNTPMVKSYTNRLLNDRHLLAAKVREEAEELVDATSHDEVAWECADLYYFAAIVCATQDVGLVDVERMLQLRSRRIRRRPGLAKPLAKS
jgi:phosphoribosyl-ATP pyrophosphohydrolase